MINFNYETDFILENETDYKDWITLSIHSEKKKLGELTYVFCDDEYLHKINVEYLNHDTLTDIISFDYTEGDVISGDIFISVERVKDNASDYNTSFNEELKRVIIHGVMHYCGYKDKSKNDELVMRKKENEKIAMFHVKH
ncbi:MULTISPECIES: rRNA maturation RNase YbeY [Flavobacterium]|uniref:Endoribonuclease YbeY n=1 Tax=Flavobacterium jumunjinense TaxID=998845 RepID=A0ABV5GQT5_9FLAO|nr:MULTISPECIES: rRNA maturation RNase YbeY [Flavobacterium]